MEGHCGKVIFGVFFTGISPNPVYLLIRDGKAELRDAAHLWGAATRETEHALCKEVGEIRLRIASIGPSGELASLISSVIVDRYGIDTISAGSAIAFAIECYENGLIGKEDTGGIVLAWGNTSAIIAMLEKTVRREGFGDVLADGVQRAAERIGKSAEKYAVHIHGQEPGLHDPRFSPYRGLTYIAHPTPGRHMTASASMRLDGERKLASSPELQAPEGESKHERMGRTQDGPLAGRNIDFGELRANYHRAMGWDASTGIPSPQTIAGLGLKEVVGTALNR